MIIEKVGNLEVWVQRNPSDFSVSVKEGNKVKILDVYFGGRVENIIKRNFWNPAIAHHWNLQKNTSANLLHFH